MDYADGKIRRATNSDIAVNQLVLIDYELTGSQLNEQLLGEAVAQADAIIDQQIDRSRHFGADTALQAAATFLAASRRFFG